MTTAERLIFEFEGAARGISLPHCIPEQNIVDIHLSLGRNDAGMLRHFKIRPIYNLAFLAVKNASWQPGSAICR